MLKDKLRELFIDYDPTIQTIIAEILTLEQQHISMKRPRGVSEHIDEIITRAANNVIAKNNTEQSSE
jgi:uncharacterized protein YaaN involved in tellurite resistance